MDLLKPYQEYGAGWMAERRRAYLGDEPGLGKTRTLLEAARCIEAANGGHPRIAVICPAIVQPHWRAEFNTIFTPHAEHEGDYPDLFVTSYQKYVMSQATRDAVDHFGPDVLILDEAHFLQSRESARTNLLIHPRNGLARKVPYVWAASGTPMPRNPAQLFPVLASLRPRPLAALGIRTYFDFLNHFCVWAPTEYGPKIFGAKNVEHLTEILDGFMLRRLTKDVLPDLPEMRWSVLRLGTTPQRLKELEEAVGADVLVKLQAQIEEGGTPTDENFARARHAIGDIKADIAVELLAHELSSDPSAKRVVFAYHRSVLEKLSDGLREFNHVRIDGSTPLDVRAAAISAFQENTNVRVFLGQIEACATGITLTAADQVVIVEPDTADMNVQAAKRIHRIGQERRCLVRMLALDGTLDVPLIRGHHREVEMVEKVVGSS